jgi:hypothetical protein
MLRIVAFIGHTLEKSDISRARFGQALALTTNSSCIEIGSDGLQIKDLAQVVGSSSRYLFDTLYVRMSKSE